MNPEKALERLLDCKSQYLEIKDKLDVSVFDKKFEQVRKQVQQHVNSVMDQIKNSMINSIFQNQSYINIKHQVSEAENLIDMMLNFWKTTQQGTFDNYFELGQYLNKFSDHLNSINGYNNGFELQYNGYQQNQLMFGAPPQNSLFGPAPQQAFFGGVQQNSTGNSKMKDLLQLTIIGKMRIKNQVHQIKASYNLFSSNVKPIQPSPFPVNEKNNDNLFFSSNNSSNNSFGNQNSNQQHFTFSPNSSDPKMTNNAGFCSSSNNIPNSQGLFVNKTSTQKQTNQSSKGFQIKLTQVPIGSNVQAQAPNDLFKNSFNRTNLFQNQHLNDSYNNAGSSFCKK